MKELEYQLVNAWKGSFFLEYLLSLEKTRSKARNLDRNMAREHFYPAVNGETLALVTFRYNREMPMRMV